MTKSPHRSVALVAGLVLASALSFSGAGAGTGQRAGIGPADGLRAANVDPPGESGLTTPSGFTTATAGLSTTYGPHSQDQLGLYATWQYKPMQFERTAGSPVPGDPHVKVGRDAYDIPTITATSENDLYYGIGFAMAQDRLFQMEVLRHVGHGTLATLIGASGIGMDEYVRRYTEGTAALDAEFAALPATLQTELRRFTAGVNAEINAVSLDPSTMPAEFVLLGDLPIAPWSVEDTLAFGEYAGRNFGEFGHGETTALAAYLNMVQRLGSGPAEAAFEAIYPLNDPAAPTTISPADGTFPRHSAPPVKTSYTGSPYANHDPSLYPSSAQVSTAAAALATQASAVASLKQLLAIPRFGSNSAVVSGRLTTTGHPMLYGGPQTGWSVPSTLWEVELHDPVRDERGVMIPTVPLLVIGRNATAAWTVTSAEDANSDTFIEQLNSTNTASLHNGKWVPVQRRTETIECHNPPTAAEALATSLPALDTGALCPLQPVTMTVFKSIHGPSLSDPDAAHHLFVRASAVDGHILQSFVAWDKVGLSTNVSSFQAAAGAMSLGFNFSYIDDAGDIAYFHAGRYPIRPANADPTLPLPGTGAYDWKGFEPAAALPHVVNPSTGFAVNWNNKPAVGWYSKALDGGGLQWGPGDQAAALTAAVTTDARRGISFNAMGLVPRQVAYVDMPATYFLPFLEPALRSYLSAHPDSRLSTILADLRSWNGLRDDLSPGGATYSTPAVVFTDRLVEHLLLDTVGPALGPNAALVAQLACGSPPCHFVSVDNTGAPTYKFEFAAEQAVLRALRAASGAGPRPTYDLFEGRGAAATLVQAARDAEAELTASQGANAARWNEPVETGAFQGQGAASVPFLRPLPNRGSYGQVVEAAG